APDHRLIWQSAAQRRSWTRRLHAQPEAGARVRIRREDQGSASGRGVQPVQRDGLQLRLGVHKFLRNGPGRFPHASTNGQTADDAGGIGVRFLSGEWGMGDKGRGRQGDKEKRGQENKKFPSPCLPLPLSPCPLVSPSPLPTPYSVF